MATTIEVPIRTVLDDEDRRRVRAVANALTKASGAVAELAEAFALLADGGRVLDDPKAADEAIAAVLAARPSDTRQTTVEKPKVGDLVKVIAGKHRYGVTGEFVGKEGRVERVVPASEEFGGIEHLQVSIPGTSEGPQRGWYIDYADVEKV